MALRNILNWFTGSANNAAPKDADGEGDSTVSAGGVEGVEGTAGLPFSVVISTPDIFPEEHAVVEELFAAGLTRFHLRKSRFSWRELREWVEALPEDLLGKVVVHSQPGLVLDYSLGGLHLRAGQRPPADWPAEIPVSYACANFDDLVRSRKPAYATIGPVFPTEGRRRDRDNEPQRTPEEYAEIVNSWKDKPNAAPLLALGGLTVDNIHLARALGFDGFAVVGSVWDAESPADAFKQLRDNWSK
jgi:thiamine-phosphate pyrophosphorylase